MRRLILQMHVTLDGYLAARPGVDWHLPEESAEAYRWIADSIRDVGAHVMGRRTYVEMAGHWPHQSDEVADLMNDPPKVVFSTTLPSANWPESRIVRGPLADEIAALKAAPGADLVAHGGVTLAQSLSRAGLVDEYRLIMRPAAVGDGLPLFSGLSETLHLNLLDAKAFPCGTVALTYRKVAS